MKIEQIAFFVFSMVILNCVTKQAAAQTALGIGQGQLLTNNSHFIAWYGVNGNSLVINTTTYVGNGSISFTTNLLSAVHNIADFNLTDAQSIAIEKTFSNSINLTNMQNLYFWDYIPNSTTDCAGYSGNWNNCISLELFSFTNSINPWSNYTYSDCPIWSASLQNGWTPIVVARSDCFGNANWSAINAMVIQVNLNASLKNNITMNFDDLRYNYTGGVFNKAQIIFTFDGGWNSTIFNALPIMQPNHQTGVVFLVTNQTNSKEDECEIGNESALNPNNINGGLCITSNQLTTLYNDGWDISSHTVDHVDLIDSNGAINLTAAYQLSKSYSNLTQMGFTRSAKYFAYPDGVYNSNAINYLISSTNYSAARALDFGIVQPNMYASDPYDLDYRIQSVSITPQTSVANIEKYIDNVTQEKGLLVLTFHFLETNLQKNTSIDSCYGAGTCYSIANFTAISNYLAQEQNAGLLQVTNFSTYFDTINNVTSTTSTSTTTTIPVNITNTTTTIAISSSTGSGGGGGGGSSSGFFAGGGGNQKPIIVAFNTSNETGYDIYNVTQDDSVNFKIANKSFTVILNYITPTDIGLTINNMTYSLTNNITQSLALIAYEYNAKLLKIDYVPIEHSANFSIYESEASTPTNIIMPIVNTTSTIIPANSTGTTVSTSSSSSLTTTINSNSIGTLGTPSSNELEYALVIIGIIIIIVLSAGHIYLSRKSVNSNRKK